MNIEYPLDVLIAEAGWEAGCWDHILLVKNMKYLLRAVQGTKVTPVAGLLFKINKSAARNSEPEPGRADRRDSFSQAEPLSAGHNKNIGTPH